MHNITDRIDAIEFYALKVWFFPLNINGIFVNGSYKLTDGLLAMNEYDNYNSMSMHPKHSLASNARKFAIWLGTS